MPWNTALCRDKTIWSLSSPLAGLFQVSRCIDHLLENWLQFCQCFRMRTKSSCHLVRKSKNSYAEDLNNGIKKSNTSFKEKAHFLFAFPVLNSDKLRWVKDHNKRVLWLHGQELSEQAFNEHMRIFRNKCSKDQAIFSKYVEGLRKGIALCIAFNSLLAKKCWPSNKTRQEAICALQKKIDNVLRDLCRNVER